jgi:hypothetical protein
MHQLRRPDRAAHQDPELGAADRPAHRVPTLRRTALRTAAPGARSGGDALVRRAATCSPGPDGSPIERTTLTQHFNIRLRRATLRRIRIHNLRHAAATLLLGQASNSSCSKELLGHAHIGVTATVCVHIRHRLQRDAISLLGNAVANPPRPPPDLTTATYHHSVQHPRLCVAASDYLHRHRPHILIRQLGGESGRNKNRKHSIAHEESDGTRVPHGRIIKTTIADRFGSRQDKSLTWAPSGKYASRIVCTSVNLDIHTSGGCVIRDTRSWQASC